MSISVATTKLNLYGIVDTPVKDDPAIKDLTKFLMQLREMDNSLDLFVSNGIRDFHNDYGKQIMRYTVPSTGKYDR